MRDGGRQRTGGSRRQTPSSSSLTRSQTPATTTRDGMGNQTAGSSGYYSGPQIMACANGGIAVVPPKPTTSSAKSHGRFDRADFIYIARDDEYQCPAGERAIYRFTAEEHGVQLRCYWSNSCPQCPMKSQCTPVRIGESLAGNMSRCWKVSNVGWTKRQKQWRYADAQLNMSSGRSSTGWATRTF